MVALESLAGRANLAVRMTPLTRLLLSAALMPGATVLFAQTPIDNAPLPPVQPQAPVPIQPLVVYGGWAPSLFKDILISDLAATTTTVDLNTLPVGADNLSGFAAQTANFSIASNNARSYTDVFALRGLTNTPIFGTPAVTVYLDDLPLGSGFTFPSELTGLATGQLYRGPGQNTLFGRAGPAGVVQLTTPESRPLGGPTDFSQVSASFGNDNTRDVSALTRTADPASDILVAVDYAARDGYITNTELGRTIDGQDASSALARLHYTLNPRVDATLLFTALDAHDGVQPLVPLGGPLFTVARPAEGLTDTEAYNTSLTIADPTAAGRLSATTSYTDWQLGPYSNLLALSPALFLGNTVLQDQRTWNEELKLTNADFAPARWTTGVFFSDGTTDGTVGRLLFGEPIEASSFHTDQYSLAAFGEETFIIGEGFTLTPGLRVEENHQTFGRAELVPVAGQLGLAGTSSAILPKLAADYSLTPEVSAYASVGTGYKPGGFSSFTNNPAFAPFGPERTTAYEAGATDSTTDHKLTATVRGFWYDITGYQIERSFTALDYFVANAPRARSRGAELEVTWKPVTGLTLGTALGYTDVTLVQFNDPVSGTSFDGHRAPYVPNYTASFRADYEDASGWFGGVGITAVGRTYYTESENLFYAQRAYALLGAHFGYGIGRWRVSVYCNNLTNVGYYSSITAGVNSGTPGAPRTYGAQLTVKF